MTHICKSCGAKVLFLVDGGICMACYTSKSKTIVPHKKMGRPVGATPFDKAKYDREYAKLNPRTEYFREKANQRYVPLKGRFVVEHEGKFRYKQGTHSEWIDSIENAKIYASLVNAQKVVDNLGCGTVKELK
jgi:hypothetical protein